MSKYKLLLCLNALSIGSMGVYLCKDVTIGWALFHLLLLAGNINGVRYYWKLV